MLSPALAPPPAPAPAGQSLQQTLTRLQTIPFDETNISPEARASIVAVKHMLRDAVLDAVTAVEPGHEAPPALTARVVDALAVQGIRVGSDTPQTVPSGSSPSENPVRISGVEIKAPTGYDDLLAVTTTLSLPCADDTSLYILARRNNAWRLVLVLESNEYSDIGKAACTFEYAVSPPSPDGSWFVATAELHCWCTSNWQEIRYTVLRPNQTTTQPDVLLQGRQGIYLGAGEPPFSLAVDRDAFELRFQAAQSLDPAILTRDHVVRYAVGAHDAQRVAPFAFRPEDFLDEWIHMPWRDASAWVDAADRARIHRWHARLDAGRFRPREILFIASSPQHPDQTRIGLETTGGKVCATVRRSGDSFSICDIAAFDDAPPAAADAVTDLVARSGTRPAL